MSTVWRVQKAVYARLSPVLAGLSPAVPLFDEAPEGQSYPYAEFARHVVTPDDGYRHHLSQTILTIAAYSAHGGQKEALEIMEAIRASLTDARLALEGGTETIRCRYERMDTARDPDGRTYVGTILFSILFRH